MTTKQQLIANRKNAVRSTGPKSTLGKLHARNNALQHGLTSRSAIIPGESEVKWELFRSSLMHDLDSVGALEQSLAERFVLLSWRQRRIVNYEIALATVKMKACRERQGNLILEQERLRKELDDQKQILLELSQKKRLFALYDESCDMKIDADTAFHLFELHGLFCSAYEIDPHDSNFLSALGIALSPSERTDRQMSVADKDNGTGFDLPDLDTRIDPYDVTQFTVEHLYRGSGYIASQTNESVDEVLDNVREAIREEIRASRRRMKELRQQLKEFETRRGRELENEAALQGIADEKNLEKIIRYEAHLTKQALSMLHELQRVQAARRNGEAPVPVALDISITADTESGNSRQADRKAVFTESGNLKQVDLIGS